MNQSEKDECAVKSVRNTRQKETVRSVFAEMRNHPTADMVYDEVSRQSPGIGRATVYRILKALADSGDVLRVPISNGADRFDFNNSPHSHVKCRGCGSVADVETNGILPTVTDDKGFLIENGAVLYSGLCPKCRN